MTQRTALVVWQLEQLEGECSLLQGHAADPSCPCESETEHCVRKHLLTIEALAKETYPMLENEGEKGIMTDLADQARTWRKQVEELAIGNETPVSNPQEPVRIERGETTEIKVFKEKSEFHAGSFRTIKPDEQTQVLVGCPVERASWRDQECVCQDTGERGCMELH